MQIDIKTTSVEPLRHTFRHVADRLGTDKPASRYQEATFDIQPEINFHYRPVWAPEHELYDARRTAIQMQDWYAFKDPRQFYYGTWTINRSKQQDSVERNFSFVEKRDLLSLMDDAWKKQIAKLIIPLRHLEYAANQHNCYITAYGHGTAITQATSFATMDRLGIAQYLSRIGLLLDNNSDDVLNQAKQAWLDDPMWQPLRRLAEDLLVCEDWFELFVAQNFVLDGLLYPLVYDRLNSAISRNGNTTLSMLTEFMINWHDETTRWVDATLKTAARESEANRDQLIQWTQHWNNRATEALTPLAEAAFGDQAATVLAELQDALRTRAQKKCSLEF